MDSVREVSLAHIAIIDFVRSRIDKKHAGLLVVFIVSAGSAMKPFTRTPDLFLTMMPNERSNPLAIT